MKEEKLPLISQKYNHKRILLTVIQQQIGQLRRNGRMPRNRHTSKTEVMKLNQ